MNQSVRNQLKNKMQLEFVADLMALQPHSGWLEKRGSVRKNWKTRYFYLGNGSLKVRISA